MGKKMYFIGPKGNRADEVADALLESLAYIPAPDGTFYIDRNPMMTDAPAIEFKLESTDSEVAKRCISRPDGISPLALFVKDEGAYRDLESEVIKEFAAQDDGDTPSGLIIGESALNREENIELIKEGIVIHCACSPEYSWKVTQNRPTTIIALRARSDQDKPPLWALANGWEFDIDDPEGKEGYTGIVGELNEEYKKVADVDIRTDKLGNTGNPYWSITSLVTMIAEHLGINHAMETGKDELTMKEELTKFLEGARLGKYLEQGLKWCEEMGAASIEDVLENPEDFAEGMGLKPLEVKRLNRAVEEASL